MSIQFRPRAWRRFSSLSPVALVGVPAVLVLVAVGCSRSDLQPVRSYEVRGQITTLFEVVPDHPRELEIHHEAIPEFVNFSGKQVGMAAMTMPFRVREGLDLTGLAVGDKVEFTMAVDWERKPPGQITAIRELPADTPLSFESKQ